ncbi:MAG: ribosome maturation factor RimM [Solirubrobacteraceae bacterium]
MPVGPSSSSDRGTGRPAEDPQTVLVGRVGKPHGLDGFFHVVDPLPAALTMGATVSLGKAEAEIVGRKGTAAAPLLCLSVASDRTAIEGFRGQDITVARSEVPALGDDEFWADDLVGCGVVAGDRSLGTVERMVAYPSCEVLVVGDLLIPMVGDAIRSVDVAGRRIEVDAGFLGI